MNYQEQLNPWVIHRLMPNLSQQTIVNRFRRRNEAESYLKAIQRMQPNLKFELIFDMHQGIQEESPVKPANTTPSATKMSRVRSLA